MSSCLRGKPPLQAESLRIAAVGVIFLAIAGCLGVDKTFPDETAAIVALHVNAYADTATARERTATIEISGLAADGQEGAFRGELHIVLEQQHYAEPAPTYTFAKEWRREVAPIDFASPDVPLVKHVVQPGDFPANSTYRASVTATVGGRSVSDSALFAYASS